MDPVFRDLEVVDLSCGIAGPYAAMFFADFGATVTKVEPPESDPARGSPGFSIFNRSKLGLLVDPGSSEDRDRLQALLRSADVCITNGPESWSSFGLTAEEVFQSNPRLIIGDVTPCEDDLAWAGHAESHGLLAAVTGIAFRQSSTDGGPIEFVSPHTLYLQGVWAATCVVAALIERQRSGLGQTVTVSGIDAALLANAMDLSGDPDEPPQTLAPGRPLSLPTYAPYKAGDGKWFLVGALHARLGLRLLSEINSEGALEGIGNSIEDLLLPENWVEVRTVLQDVFLTKTREQWMAWFDERDIPYGPVLDPRDWLQHPQLEANGLRIDLDEADRGHLTMPGLPLDLGATPTTSVASVPRLGEHNSWAPSPGSASKPEAPLRGPVAAEPDQPVGGGPLVGLRVLNPGAFIAGPVVGFLLAELGAEVIKVEPPSGDPFRMSAFMYNRGMQSVALDLKEQEAQAVFHQLVASSDVVINNARSDVDRRLTTDYESLRATNEDIVAVTISAFGKAGPLAERPGFDAVLGAYSGLMAAQGGRDDPIMLSLPFVDVMTGILGALGACMGMFDRSRGGPGRHIETSLAAASTAVQAGELVGYVGSPPPPQGGLDFHGRHPWDRFYQTKDAWLRIQADSGDVGERRFREAVVAAGLVDQQLANSGREQLEVELLSVFARMTGEEVTSALQSHGVVVATARSGSDLVRDHGLRASGIIQEQRRQNGRTYVMPGPAVTFSRTPRRGVLVPPGIGEHTRVILGRVGIEMARIDELVNRGVIAEGPRFDPVFLPRYR